MADKNDMLGVRAVQTFQSNWLDYSPWSLISVLSSDVHLPNVFSYEVLLRFEAVCGTITLSCLDH